MYIEESKKDTDTSRELLKKALYFQQSYCEIKDNVI